MCFKSARKYQKHETFRTFGPKCAKSPEFLTLSGGQAGLSTPRGRKRAPASARKTSKTRCFSLFGPEKYKKLYAFHYLGQKKIKNSRLFAHPRQNVRKVLSFWHFFALGVARGRGRGTKWGMGQEKGQKHDTFRTFGPKCAKSLEFLILSGGQAGLSTPRGRKRAPAGARKI